MIVPRYWAEARTQHVKRTAKGRRQWTVRRFGWSDTSEAEAQQMADARAAEALQQIVAGKKLARRELKVPYNGAAGVPIREEIVDRQGESVLTRNRYGALCLNTPNVAFVDIDHDIQVPPNFGVVMAVLGCLAGIAAGSVAGSYPKAVMAGIVGIPLGLIVAWLLVRLSVRLRGGDAKVGLRRIERFFQRTPDVMAALYETPAGFRLLFLHDLIEPDGSLMTGWFDALGADKHYAAMCRNQKCFRARVSPKPWRIGLNPLHHITAAVWPIPPEKQARRGDWVTEYDRIAPGYASCRFVALYGSAPLRAEAKQVQQWHDELSRACNGLPLA